MRNADEARAEAIRRKWSWVIYDADNWRWGYARTKPVSGRDKYLYLPVSMSVENMKVAAFEYLDSGRR